MRRLVWRLHLWCALAGGLVLLVIGITGCLLVFELSMDQWLDPGVFSVAPQGRTVPFAKLVDRVHSAFPAKRITQVNLFGAKNSVEIRVAPDTRAYLNPYTGALVGTRTGEPPSFWVRHIHRELAGGKTGQAIVRVASFIVLFQSISGLWLWWPLKRVKVNFAGSWRRIHFDLHHSVGFFSSVLLFILAGTGLVKSFGDQLQPLFDRMTGEPAAVRAAVVHRAPGAGPIGFDRALAIARETLPGARPARITPPKSAADPVVITMKFPGDSTAPGRSWVVLDPYSGQVLASQDARHAPAAAMIPIVNRAIHVGGFAGAPSRILAFLVSLALLVQIVTGFVMWWKKRGARPAKTGIRAAVSTEVSKV